MNPMTGQIVLLVTTESRTRPPSTTGIAKKMSVIRDISESQPPPKYPASPPRTEPSSATSGTAGSIGRRMPVEETAPSDSYCSGIADPRVEYGVQEVDQQVGHQEHEDEYGHEADDGLGVLAQDALVELVADAVDVEDPLGD